MVFFHLSSVEIVKSCASFPRLRETRELLVKVRGRGVLTAMN